MSALIERRINADALPASYRPPAPRPTRLVLKIGHKDFLLPERIGVQEAAALAYTLGQAVQITQHYDADAHQYKSRVEAPQRPRAHCPVHRRSQGRVHRHRRARRFGGCSMKPTPAVDAMMHLYFVALETRMALARLGLEGPAMRNFTEAINAATEAFRDPIEKAVNAAVTMPSVAAASPNVTRELGKIKSARVEQRGDRFLVRLQFVLGASGMAFVEVALQMQRDDHRALLRRLMNDAQVKHLDELVGKPVQVTLVKDIYDGVRILKEVL